MAWPYDIIASSAAYRVPPISDDIGEQTLRRLMGLVTAKSVDAAAPWQIRWATRFEWLANKLRGIQAKKALSGKLLSFQRRGGNLGYPVYRVVSTRGGFEMGTIDWSNQWHRARFKADSEAVFDQQCIAEIYAMMKEVK